MTNSGTVLLAGFFGTELKIEVTLKGTLRKTKIVANDSKQKFRANSPNKLQIKLQEEVVYNFKDLWKVTTTVKMNELSWIL